MLASQQNAASDGGGDILTTAELTRASALMTGMSAAQQQAFERLLANAKSPAEAAYLMKALVPQRYTFLAKAAGTTTMVWTEYALGCGGQAGHRCVGVIQPIRVTVTEQSG